MPPGRTAADRAREKTVIDMPPAAPHSSLRSTTQQPASGLWLDLVQWVVARTARTGARRGALTSVSGLRTVVADPLNEQNVGRKPLIRASGGFLIDKIDRRKQALQTVS